MVIKKSEHAFNIHTVSDKLTLCGVLYYLNSEILRGTVRRWWDSCANLQYCTNSSSVTIEVSRVWCYLNNHSVTNFFSHYKFAAHIRPFKVLYLSVFFACKNLAVKVPAVPRCICFALTFKPSSAIQWDYQVSLCVNWGLCCAVHFCKKMMSC